MQVGKAEDLYRNPADMIAGQRFGLQAVMKQGRTARQRDFTDAVGEAGGRPDTHIFLHQAQLAVARDAQQHPRIEQQTAFATDDDQMQGLADLNLSVGLDQHAVAEQRGIQGMHGAAAADIGRDQAGETLGIVVGECGETFHA